MGWDQGGHHYTRSRKVPGRVVREYVCTGDRAAPQADADVGARRHRQSVS
jgi:hypothetical protein